MILKYHKNITIEKWGSYSFCQQDLMIANELNRAGKWIETDNVSEVRRCYERAFELLYLTASTIKKFTLLRELMRFKEMLGHLYLEEKPSSVLNAALQMALISLSPEAFRMVRS